MRVVIAEDSVLLRAGLTRLLDRRRLRGRRGGRRRRRAARARSPSTGPTLAVIDVRMPPTHTDEGIRAALVIRAPAPGRAVLVLSQYVEERYATDLLVRRDQRRRLPAQGPRRRTSRDFLDALRRVAAGGTALDPEVVAQLLVRAATRPARPAHPARAARCCG